MNRIANAFWSEDEGTVALDRAVLLAGALSLGFAVAATLAGDGGHVTAEVSAPLQHSEPSGGA